jgi:hypothetical protein
VRGYNVNTAIELHDSGVVSVELTGTNAVVRFDPAYVHKSTGVPGVSTGEGWVQNAEAIIEGAVIVTGDEISGEVWDGHLVCDNRRLDSVVEIPFSFEGRVVFFVEFKSGKKLEITGSSIQIRTTSHGKYVEAFEGEQV